MLKTLLSVFLLLAATANAAPRVVTDIAPIHSLVAMVMDGVASPELLIKASASPHGLSLRPKQARALQQADIVFWIGPDLTPWLEKPLQNLADNAVLMQLSLSAGITQHPYRHADHDHGALDPHLWLDPENGKLWLRLIARSLGQVDPQNATRYLANAARGRAALNALQAEIQATLAPVRNRGFLVFHDSFQYFEARFGLLSSGAISLGDGSKPSAARIAEARKQVRQGNIFCVFSEPQFDGRLVQTVIEGTQLRTAILDPMGSDLESGAALYSQLLRNLATTFRDCLKP